MIANPEYKQHRLQVVTTLSKAGSWGVEVSVTWQQGLVERKMKWPVSGLCLSCRRSMLGNNFLYKLDRPGKVRTVSLHSDSSSTRTFSRPPAQSRLAAWRPVGP